MSDRDSHRTPWWERGSCQGMNVELFYPVGPAQDCALALAVCRRCPVRQTCLSVAISTREPHGIWGGQTEEERRLVLAG